MPQALTFGTCLEIGFPVCQNDPDIAITSDQHQGRQRIDIEVRGQPIDLDQIDGAGTGGRTRRMRVPLANIADLPPRALNNLVQIFSHAGSAAGESARLSTLSAR